MPAGVSSFLAQPPPAPGTLLSPPPHAASSIPAPPTAPSPARSTTVSVRRSTLEPAVIKERTEAVVSNLPKSSFERLLELTQGHLAAPEDPRAVVLREQGKHSEVGRAFWGELRDSEGQVVSGRRMGELALRLAVLGVVKRELGRVENIAFLPERESDKPEPLLPRDKFRLLLIEPPSLPPPTSLRSNPITANLTYLPVQPGYAFPLRLPRWSMQKTVGGPSLDEVVRVSVGEGEGWGMLPPQAHVEVNEQVAIQRDREGLGKLLAGLEENRVKHVAAPLVEEGAALPVEAGAAPPSDDATGADALSTPTLDTSAQPEATSMEAERKALPSPPETPSQVPDHQLDPEFYPERQAELERARAERLEAERAEAEEAALLASLEHTLILTPMPMSSHALEPTNTYPPSMTFGHPYPAITRLAPFRDFETRLWPALRLWEGFAGGLERARVAMAARLGIADGLGSAQEEREKVRAVGNVSPLAGLKGSSGRAQLPHTAQDEGSPSYIARLQSEDAQIRAAEASQAKAKQRALEDRALPPLPPSLAAAKASSTPPPPPAPRAPVVPAPEALPSQVSGLEDAAPEDSPSPERRTPSPSPKATNESTLDVSAVEPITPTHDPDAAEDPRFATLYDEPARLPPTLSVPSLVAELEAGEEEAKAEAKQAVDCEGGLMESVLKEEADARDGSVAPREKKGWLSNLFGGGR